MSIVRPVLIDIVGQDDRVHLFRPARAVPVIVADPLREQRSLAVRAQLVCTRHRQGERV